MIYLSDSQIMLHIQRAAFRAFFEVLNIDNSNILLFSLNNRKAIIYHNSTGLIYSFCVQESIRINRDSFYCETAIERYKPFMTVKNPRQYCKLSFTRAQIMSNCSEKNGYGYGYLVEYIKNWLNKPDFILRLKH